MGIGDVLQGGAAGGYFIWVRDVSDEPAHEWERGKLPAQFFRWVMGRHPKR